MANEQRGSSVYDNEEKPWPLFDALRAPDGVNPGLQRSTHLQSNETSHMFFSQQNIDRIQAGLRDAIRKQMGYVIDRQSDEQLQIVMRYVYMQSGRNEGGWPEVQRLNHLVLREIVPQVGSGLAQYLGYLKDASTLRVPMARGQATSIKGTKTTELFKGL